MADKKAKKPTKKQIRASYTEEVRGWIVEGSNDLVVHDAIRTRLGLSEKEAGKLLNEAHASLAEVPARSDAFYRQAFFELFVKTQETDSSTALKALVIAQKLDSAHRAHKSLALEGTKEGAIDHLVSTIERLEAGTINNATAQTLMQATGALIKALESTEESQEETETPLPDLSQDELSRSMAERLTLVFGGKHIEDEEEG